MDDLKEVIEEVKIRSDICDIISEYVHLKSSGSNYKGLCPFHNEKTPSFLVSSSKQIFKCFGCGESGDVIAFIMKVENLDFMDAVKFLAERCGIEINSNIDEKTKARLAKVKRYQEMHQEAARFYFYILQNTQNQGKKYLEKRGLDEKTIKNFGLGYSPDSWDSLYNHLVSKGYKDEEIKDAGLVGVSKKDTLYDKFRNRVMFPIFDYRGNVIGFGGRVLDESLPKYLNSQDTLIFNKRFNLYGLNLARKNISQDRTIILVEGYMDMISLYQFGVKNVVATLGTALTDSQAQLIKRFADNVIISYDSDQAGINATLRAISIVESNGLKARVLNLGKSKDPDEFIRFNGLNEFLNRVDDSIEGTRFKLDILYKNYDHNKQGETIKFLKESINILKYIKSPLELDFYEKYLSNITSIDVEVIRSELSSIPRNDSFNKNGLPEKKDEYIVVKKEKPVENGSFFIELNLLKMMMISQKAREIVPLKISIDNISDDNNKVVYQKILSSNKMGLISIIDLNIENMGIDYLRKLDSIDLKNIDFDNTKEVYKIINNLLREYTNENILKLTEKMEMLEQSLACKINEKKDTNEVELEIMKIALEIVSEKKKLKSL